jgi:hypothetical protein
MNFDFERLPINYIKEKNKISKDNHDGDKGGSNRR